LLKEHLLDIDGWMVVFDPARAPRGKQQVPASVRYPSRLPDRRWKSCATSCAAPG
jgi:hypothetical protein